MKLLIITQYFPPEMGAPQNRLKEMALGLQKKGTEVEVITAMPNYPTGKIFDDYKGKFYKKETIEGLTTHRYWLYPSNSRRTIPRILSMLSFTFTVLFSVFKVRKLKPDYILVESPPLTLAFSAWLLCKITGAKLLMNVSDLWPLSAKELGAISEGTLYQLIEKLEVFLYKKSYAVIGQSEQIINYIKNKGAKQVHLFRNGVDVSRFAVDVKKIESDKLVLVYTGLLGVAQGVLGIAKNINFNELNAEFHIYGAGPEEDELIEYLKNNSEKGIFFHGKVSSSEIPSISKKHHAMIVPLVQDIYGAVPSKIYEAMAAGLPILFSATGEGAEIIQKHEVGLTSEPLDYEALKENIKKLSSNKELAQKLSGNCKKAAQNIFSREIQIEKLYKFLIS